MSSIIEIKNISKCYNITGRKRGYVALRDIFSEYLKHPFASGKNLIKSILGRNRNETFWALKDINFTVEKGEAIGLIGANGAGKSTLLKILSRITPPTTGEISLTGKVASLLEVGTGFHPELTGRENIFLNGAILGMTRKEIAKKFDAIVSFSGIGDFIDTPVKRYSSGMYVRLAFSIAAHIEPDILLVDEVLAVGDAEFQKKCLGKMEEVTGKAGRTILFVSHNMGAIQKLCSKTVLLDKGRIVMIGPTDTVIGHYLSKEYHRDNENEKIFPIVEDDIVMRDFSIRQKDIRTLHIDPDEPFEVMIDFETKKDLTLFRTGIYVKNALGDAIIRSFLADWQPECEKLSAGHYVATLNFPDRLLMPGSYHITLHASRFGTVDYLTKYNVSKAVIVAPSVFFNQAHPNEGTGATILMKNQWDIKKI